MKKSSGSRSRKQRLTVVGTRCADNVTPLYPQKLALISPTGGGRSVGIVRVRTKRPRSLVQRQAAILCSVGWLEVQLIVVSVYVGFRKMSISIWVGCRIISRSRELTLFLCLKVRVNCRLGCTLFVWLWIISGVVCFVLYISRMSSTYLAQKVMFYASSTCFRCVFSKSCRNM